MASSESFPAVDDAEKELNTGIDNDFEVDPISSNAAAIEDNRAGSGSIPAIDAEKEMNTGIDKDFEVEPISSNVPAIEDNIDTSGSFPAVDAEKELNTGINMDSEAVSSNVVAIEDNNMARSGSFPIPAVDAEKELNPGMDKDSEVDPIPSNVASPNEIEEQIEAERMEEHKRKDAIQSFKTALIVSGIVVAVTGAVFAVVKKLREK